MMLNTIYMKCGVEGVNNAFKNGRVKIRYSKTDPFLQDETALRAIFSQKDSHDSTFAYQFVSEKDYPYGRSIFSEIAHNLASSKNSMGIIAILESNPKMLWFVAKGISKMPKKETTAFLNELKDAMISAVLNDSFSSALNSIHLMRSASWAMEACDLVCATYGNGSIYGVATAVAYAKSCMLDWIKPILKDAKNITWGIAVEMNRVSYTSTKPPKWIAHAYSVLLETIHPNMKVEIEHLDVVICRGVVYKDGTQDILVLKEGKASIVRMDRNFLLNSKS